MRTTDEPSARQLHLELYYGAKFYLWSYATIGVATPYWEFMDKLIAVHIPMHIAQEILQDMIEHPVYFDVEETESNVFFIKKPFSALG